MDFNYPKYRHQVRLKPTEDVNNALTMFRLSNSHVHFAPIPRSYTLSCASDDIPHLRIALGIELATFLTDVETPTSDERGRARDEVTRLM